MEHNEDLEKFIDRLNEHNRIQKFQTTYYKKLGVEEKSSYRYGYIELGEDTDISGEWQDKFKKYYFKINDFFSILNSLKKEGNAVINSKGVLYEQSSRHDPYYPGDDFRNEKVQSGMVRANIEISNNILDINDITFDPISQQRIWQASSVRELHTNKIRDFVREQLEALTT
jgi:ribosome biogenesis protein Nip4